MFLFSIECFKLAFRCTTPRIIQLYQKTFTWIFLLLLLLVTAMFVFANDLNTNCGNKNKYNSSFGKIRFPSIGTVFSNDNECRWAIDVAPNILRVEINDVDLEYDEKCIYEYVGFYDDPTYQNEISKYCSNKNVIFYSKSGILYIKVVTNANKYESGFTLTWSSTTATNAQILVSPEIKNETYFSEMSSYAIKSNLTFICAAIGTPAPFVYWDYQGKLSENCIFIESGFNSSYLKTINCQYSFSKSFSCHATNIAGTDKQVIIISGLNADCGNNSIYNKTYGKIRFPSIGNEYLNNIECRWKINVAPNILRIESNDVDLEHEDKCSHDYVAFYDDRTYQNEISRYCSNKNVFFFHKSGIIYIKVVTDANSYASGFTLTWSSLTADNSQVFVSPKIKSEIYFFGIHYADKSNATFKCEASGTPPPYVYWDYQWKLFEYCIFSESGFNLSYLKIIGCQDDFKTQFVCRAINIAGTDEKSMEVSTSDFNANCGNKSTFNDLFGKIRFPSIGDEYSNNVECRWLIDVAPYMLRVDINVDLHDYDCRDYVAFYDNHSFQNEISRYCSNKNVVFFHKSGILYIKVVTSSGYASGFILTWNSEDAESSQVLVSPKIKYETYFSGIHYANKLSATIKCEASGTPPPYVYWDYQWKLFENCIFSESGFNLSYLKIIGCQDDFRTKFVCRAINIAGTDEQLMDVLTSDFNANCGNNSTFNNLFGIIHFPSIGNVYSNNVECRWLIDVAPYILRVEIKDVDLEIEGKCFDYVAFYDDRAYQNEISRYCSNKNVVLYGKSGILYISVATDGSGYASGFTLTWNSEHAKNSQVLVSPKINNETYFSGTHFVDKSNATFKCEASGTPAPYVYWDYQWKIFKNCIFSESGFNLSYLKIIRCQDDFETQLVCRAISIAGTDEKAINIVASDPPSATHFFVSFPSKSLSLILKWEKIQPNKYGNKVTKYHVEYCITTLEVSDSFQIEIPPDDNYMYMNYTLTGLISDEYTIKVYGNNIIGSGAPALLQANPSFFDYINQKYVLSYTQSTLLGSLNVLKDEYTVSFNIKPIHFSKGQKNILQLTFTNITKGCSHDYLSIGFHDNGFRKLVINSSENAIAHIVTDSLAIDHWYNIRIFQRKLTTGILFAVYLNGANIYRKHFYKVCQEKYMKNVTVYVISPWGFVQNNSISDLLISNGKADYHVGNSSIPVSRGNKVARLPILDEEYLISLEVFPRSFDNNFGNVIYFDNYGFKELNNIGILKIDFGKNGEFFIQFKDVEKFITKPVQLNEWYKIEILQTLKSSKHIYMIKLNEEIVFSQINDKAQRFFDLEVYASSHCDLAHNSLIKNFFVNSNQDYINRKIKKSQNKEYLVVNNTTPLVKGKLIGHISKLFKEYFVSFDVFPQKFDVMKNVIDFTIGSYSQNNNKSILGIWFHKYDEQRGFLSITSDSFELEQDLSIHFSPLEPNVWSNIEINQTKIDGTYNYIIKINDIIVFSKTIKRVNGFDNVNVYASNTWNENANGSIKNLFFVNGNSKDQPEKIRILSNVCDLCTNRCENDTTGFPYCLCSIGYIGDGYTCTRPGSSQTSKLTSILVPVVVVFIIIVIMVVVVLRIRRRKEIWNKDFYNYGNYMNYYKVVSDEWEISPKSLVFNEKIGEGAFGNVLSAKIDAQVIRKTIFAKQSAFVSSNDNNKLNVAVKLLKDNAHQSEYSDFCEEIDLMKGIGYHKYIVNMIGCSRVRKPLCLVLEFMENGDLLHFLRSNRTKLRNTKETESFMYTKNPKHLETSKLIRNESLLSEVITPKDLLKFAWEISSGMEYLSSIKLVHRDLAARNILVSATKNVKISDFGLSRKVNEKLVYVSCRSRRLPIRWMSVEAIFDRNFTTYSDVWAYGIVLFEIVTLGGSPYPTIGNRELLQLLKSGYRMKRPENCSQPMYDIMLNCWSEDPTQRPTFTDLRKVFEEIISQGDSYLTFDIDEGNNYYNVSSFHSKSSGASNDLEEEIFKAPVIETSV